MPRSARKAPGGFVYPGRAGGELALVEPVAAAAQRSRAQGHPGGVADPRTFPMAQARQPTADASGGGSPPPVRGSRHPVRLGGMDAKDRAPPGPGNDLASARPTEETERDRKGRPLKRAASPLFSLKGYFWLLFQRIFPCYD